jgi:hypothetical protein
MMATMTGMKIVMAKKWEIEEGAFLNYLKVFFFAVV